MYSFLTANLRVVFLNLNHARGFRCVGIFFFYKVFLEKFLCKNVVGGFAGFIMRVLAQWWVVWVVKGKKGIPLIFVPELS